MKLSSSQFVDAIARHLNESKPDPLVKGQINSLHVNWEQHASNDVDCGSGDSDDAADTSSNLTSSFRGTLTLSSEYISVAIHVACYWKKKLPSDNDVTSEAKIFQEEFYIKMNACARCCEERQKQQEHKELKSKKLHAGMRTRLHSDHYIKRLFHGDTEEGATLCEALIQQNLQTDRTTGRGGVFNELEERVNVEEGTLQGIKNAIFSQCEDNLDVLELLLNMPYLPRSSLSSSPLDDDKETVPNQWQCKLADRAYLRLLEDAMFDACEKEGEDELLDDLKLSGDQHYVAQKGGKEGSGVRKGGSKKIRKTA